MSDFVQAAQITEAKQMFDRLQANLRRTIKGKDDVIGQVLVCLAAGGHLLIEDLPGLGKTTLAYALARSMDCTFARIQFTSDLLPSDVTGVAIYDETVKEFVFKRGPVFASIVLADEINRATPKTQSALLEVMDRGKVTVDGEAHAVGPPFMVFATQNPVDYEGTFPLPESQTDRFLMRLQMGYPQGADELEILRTARLNYDAIELNPVVTHGDMLKLQAAGAAGVRRGERAGIHFENRRGHPHGGGVQGGHQRARRAGVEVRGAGARAGARAAILWCRRTWRKWPRRCARTGWRWPGRRAMRWRNSARSRPRSSGFSRRDSRCRCSAQAHGSQRPSKP